LELRKKHMHRAEKIQKIKGLRERKTRLCENDLKRFMVYGLGFKGFGFLIKKGHPGLDPASLRRQSLYKNCMNSASF